MSFLLPTSRSRFNEVAGVVFLSAAILFWLSLLSYQSPDASWNTAAGEVRPHNLIGPLGARLADLGLQAFGLAAFVFPVLLLLLAWKWMRSEPVETAFVKVFGAGLFVLSLATALGLLPGWRIFGGAIPAGGLTGILLAGYFQDVMNVAGAAVLAVTCLIVSVYLVSTFSIYKLEAWFSGPARVLAAYRGRWAAWREERQRRKQERARSQAQAGPCASRIPKRVSPVVDLPSGSRRLPRRSPSRRWRTCRRAVAPVETLVVPLEPEAPPPSAATRASVPPHKQHEYQLPSTDLLNEPAGRSPYDEQELKEIAARIKSKFEEFNVLGSVVQINPGPGGHHLRVQAGSGHQVQPHHHADRGPVPRACRPSRSSSSASRASPRWESKCPTASAS